VADVKLREIERLIESARAAGDSLVELGSQRLRLLLRAGRLPLEAVEAAAYLGDPVARVVACGEDHCYGCELSGIRYAGRETGTGAARCADCLDLPAWSSGLACKGTGRRTAPPLAAFVGVVVARGCLGIAHGWGKGPCPKPCPPCECPKCGPARRALDAAARWCLEPTEERREAIRGAVFDLRSDEQPWRSFANFIAGYTRTGLIKRAEEPEVLGHWLTAASRVLGRQVKCSVCGSRYVAGPSCCRSCGERALVPLPNPAAVRAAALTCADALIGRRSWRTVLELKTDCHAH